MAKSSANRITSIKEIAKIAGCSIATVSNTLNGKGRISQEVRDKVFAICKKYGYLPNSAGRNLRRRRNETIGVIFYPSTSAIFSNIYYAEIMAAVESTLESKNHDLLLSGFQTATADNKGSLRIVRQGKVDGVILLGHFPRQIVKQFKDYGLPIILLDDRKLRIQVDAVTTDGYKAGREIVDHLVSLGHRRMAFMAYEQDGYNAEQRMAGFNDGIKAHNLPQTLNTSLKNFTVSPDGYEELKTLLQRKRPPTAVVAVNDTLAWDLLQYLKEDGISVPDDLSIFGFDDDSIGHNCYPPLSTVRVNKQELGRIGVETLLNRIENPSAPVTVQHLPTELVHRQSVAACS